MGGSRSNAKIGPVGEIGVAYQLVRRGWCVFAPLVSHNLMHFDLLAHRGGQIHRIQVKCTSKLERGTQRYGIMSSMGNYSKKKYTKKECDFIIASINPVEWYFVFPVEEVRVTTLRIPANLPPDHRLNQYKDAWHLLDYL